MNIAVALTIICSLSLVPSGTSATESSSCQDCIVINNMTGRDTPSCLQKKATSNTPCKTISFVLNDSMPLNNTKVVLQGDQWIEQTLTISRVKGLVIQGSGSAGSTIRCPPPTTHSDIGSGLVFRSVSNLTMLNVVIEGCGTLQLSTTVRNGVNIKYRSAMYIINSTNINFTNISLLRSVGRGLSMHDVDGNILIEGSTFSNNKVPDNELTLLFGGGGLYIEFTYCSPGYPYCNEEGNSHNSESEYVIRSCLFNDNRATNNEVTAQINIVQFRRLSGSDGNNAGQGGGIHITMKGSSFQNFITIENCHFHNNSAQYGGGIDALIQDNSNENNVTVSGCTFVNNSALERSGGAMNLGFTSGSSVTYNTIRVQDTLFTNNTAGRGGAISSRITTTLTNRLEFINCNWTGNSASIGAAVSLRPSARTLFFNGMVPKPLFQRCSFIGNRVINSATFLLSATDGITQHVLQTGALHIESTKIDFRDYVSFVGNMGSAVVATSSQITVLENTEACFINNQAVYGGAIALLGLSILELHSSSQVIFDSNQASELGGAIYATSSHQTEFIYSHTCFISYNPYKHPNNWTAVLVFNNNKASRYGHAIYADSVLPCAQYEFDIVTNISSALKWNSFKYTGGIEQNTIATSPASINFTVPNDIAPGEEIDINSLSLDDFGQPISSTYQVFLKVINGEANTSPYISDVDYLEITGEPGSKFNLTLQTQTTRLISLSRSGTLGNCPIGLTLVNGICVCSASTDNKYFFGIKTCDMSKFRALLQVGSWIGCTTHNDKVATSYCPLKYCNYNDRQNFLVPRTCSELAEENMCFQHRRGQLCGECEEGYSVYYHSDIYTCGKCSYGAVGLVIYIAAELIPLIVLFSTIMLMKLSMTSGPMQSLLLFAQTITLINSICSFSTRSQTSYTFIKFHTLIVGFLKLDFFVLNELSFCLWKGATALDNLAWRYVTTLAAILLIVLYILVVKYHTSAVNILFCNKVKKFVKKIRLFKNAAAVHGISTFLILSYTQYTVTSFRILSRLPLYGEGGKTLGHVVHLQGNVDYFGTDHLPYAIPALLVLLVLSLPPPLLLISYPLLWKIKAKLRRNVVTENDTTVWPIRKLLPLIDSFQGVFRDNRRMFAGLLFLWRIILTAIFAFSSNALEFYVMMEIALLIFFVIHAVARPYKRQLYNMIDAVMFANLAIINALYWYNANKPTEAVTAMILVLMYLPLACLAILVVLWLLRKYGIISKQLELPTTEEIEPSTESTSYTLDRDHRATLKKQRDKCTDDDLFSRAAETNNSTSLHLTCSEAGFELQSGNTTLTNVSNKTET